MYHDFLIHSSADGHLDCFHVLAIVNSASMNSGVHVSFSTLVSSGYMPTRGIAGSYGGFILSFLRNLHTIFHSGCISLHSHQQCKSFPFSTLSPGFIVCRLFDNGLVWGDISLWFWFAFLWEWAMLSIFSCVCMSSLEKCLFRSFSHFLIGLFVFWALSCISCFWKLILCQLFHLLLFSPILRVVFSPCL